MDNLLTTPTPEANRRPNVTPVEFWTEYKMQGDQMVPVDFVKWVKRGDFHSFAMVEQIARLSKPVKMLDDTGMPVTNPVWAVIEPHYQAWKRGQEVPEHGTPLESWPLLNKAQIKVLRAAMYRTVEDVAAITDSDLQRVRLPDARMVRDRARQFLQAKSDTAAIDKAMGERDARIAALEAERAEDRRLMAEMAAKLRELDEAPKARRGRDAA